MAKATIKVSQLLKELGNPQESVKHLERVILKNIISTIFDLQGNSNPLLNE